MREETLEVLLSRVGHVGELARLLSVLGSQRSGSLRRRDLVELVGRTAGAGHRYPRPIAAIELAEQLGLVRKTGSVLRLTQTGIHFLTKPSKTVLDLNPFQGQLLLGLILDDQKVRDSVSSLLRNLEEGENGRLGIKAAMVSPIHLADTARLLQQLGALEYQDGVLALRQDFEWAMADRMTSAAALSEESLWARVEAQRERALRIEKLVLGEERLRLIHAGREDLADAVFRISEVNVVAGYDIESFEIDGSKRCIEVKSSTGRQIRFEWSLNERRHAELLRNRYWVYFVPIAHALPADFCPAVMIRDPFGLIRSGAFGERPCGFEVVEKSRTPVDGKIPFSLSCRMAEWFETS